MTRHLLVCILAAGALACGDYGGGSGGGTTSLGGGGGSGSTSSASVGAFTQTAYPLLRDYCAECHSGSGPGSPPIAHSDSTTAYFAVMDNQKANLTTPANSRLVQRLVSDFHHCWSSCMQDGQEMAEAIAAWAAMVEDADSGGGTSVEGLVSGSARLDDGVLDDGGDRYRKNLIAFFDFKEETGNVARDQSGVAPAMDLSLDGPALMSSYGIAIESGRAIASADTSRKLYDRIASPQQGSGQYSIEAWVVPDNVDQEGPARIVSYSNGTSSRNFTLGQVLYTYDFRNRTISPEIDDNGSPTLATSDDDEDLQATLQHVVATYDPYNGRRIYVDGRFTGDDDGFAPNHLWNWDPQYRFVLGNETSGNRQWKGQIRMVAIYNQALTRAQIRQNYDAGVGKRVFVRFDLSRWVSGAGLDFVVTELDDYSYLFCQPTLVGSLDGLRVANLRIAVNGVVPVTGQAFTHVDATARGSKYELSQQCSIIPKDLGPDDDVFSIVFEVLGTFGDPVPDDFPPFVPNDDFDEPPPDEGFRDFDRVNETMARLTGVDPLSSGVRDTFDELQQALPPTYDLRSFLSSHQVSIAKLALEYCDAMVESDSLRQSFFGSGFDFDAPPPDAGDAEWDVVIDALYDQMIGSNLGVQPSQAEFSGLMRDLISDLTAVCGTSTCDAERTRTVVKAACAAVLSSAPVHVH
jgi:hypothetical protein